MEEDKCYHRRLRVGRVSRLGPLLIWIPRTLRRCMVLQVVKLSELLSSHPWLLPNGGIQVSTYILNLSGLLPRSRHWLPVNLIWLNESCIWAMVCLGNTHSAVQSSLALGFMTTNIESDWSLGQRWPRCCLGTFGFWLTFSEQTNSFLTSWFLPYQLFVRSFCLRLTAETADGNTHPQSRHFRQQFGILVQACLH